MEQLEQACEYCETEKIKKILGETIPYSESENIRQNNIFPIMQG